MAVSDDDFGRRLVAMTPRLEAYAWQLCGSAERAQNLACTTLAKAWEARRQWAGNGFEAWLFRILHNQLADEQRSWQRRSIVATDQIEEIAADPLWATPGDLAMMREEIRLVWAKLSQGQRAVILLLAVRRLTNAEAAAVLACPKVRCPAG